MANLTKCTGNKLLVEVKLHHLKISNCIKCLLQFWHIVLPHYVHVPWVWSFIKWIILTMWKRRISLTITTNSAICPIVKTTTHKHTSNIATHFRNHINTPVKITKLMCKYPYTHFLHACTYMRAHTHPCTHACIFIFGFNA